MKKVELIISDYQSDLLLIALNGIIDILALAKPETDAKIAIGDFAQLKAICKVALLNSKEVEE